MGNCPCWRTTKRKAENAGETGVHSLRTFQVSDFKTLCQLGKGGFGKVYLALNRKDNRLIALKVIDKETILRKGRPVDAFIERNVMLRLRHRYILFLYGTFQTPHHLYYVMDFLGGGDLFHFIKKQPDSRLTLGTAKQFAAQVIVALSFLHSKGILYRDLKPENILLTTEGRIVLADFGLSKDLETADAAQHQGATSVVGSPYYIAPEVLTVHSGSPPYSISADWWSFGVLLYRMIYGKNPFTGRSKDELFTNILREDLTFQEKIPGDATARDLIVRLLDKRPESRLSVQRIKEHAFFSDIDFEALERGPVPRPDNWVAPPSSQELLEKYMGSDPLSNSSAGPLLTTAEQMPLHPDQQRPFDRFTAVGSRDDPRRTLETSYGSA